MITPVGLPGGVRRIWLIAVAVAVAVAVAACSGGPILANPPAPHGSPIASPTAPAALPDPQPVVFPRDDGPHHRLTEWWYSTGHLRTDTGRTFGFEYVVFRAERGSFPVSWASHLALTDEAGGRFLYDQRSEIGPQVDRSPTGTDGAPVGFALSMSGSDAASASAVAGSAWRMDGANGTATLIAAGSSSVPAGGSGPVSFAIQLGLSTAQPPVLHDTVGYVSFGEAGGSYYYSRPRMSATGAIRIGSQTFNATGEAWFDHQWGDFISVGGGGWDWFAVNLDDGTDVTLSLVRDATGGYPLVYGTLVHADGSFEHLSRDAFSVDVLGAWTSPHTGARYPAGWRVSIPDKSLEVTLEPTVPDQELDTRPTTGVVYWEGSERVTATHQGHPMGGGGYVELTGYGPTAKAVPNPTP